MTLHACAIVLDTHGVLICGPSGSGKSELCHRLIAHWHEKGRFACWIADDQVEVATWSNALIARSPKSIAGKAERRFSGVHAVDYESAAILDLAIELVPEQQLERLPIPSETAPLKDAKKLPLVHAPAQKMSQAVALVATQLEILFA